jgi:hypothetical protein
MKEIGNFIGGAFTLFIFGAIVYGIFKEGHTLGIIIIIAMGILIWLSVIRAEKKENKEKLMKQALAKAELEEKKRIEKIEKMTEEEFISFVKYNHNELNSHFKNGGVSRLGYGCETMRWLTSKYIIESTVDTNNFNEFIDIYRKSDKTKIFSGCWGYEV